MELRSEGARTTVDVQTLTSQAGLPTTDLTARRSALPPDVQDLHRRVLLCFAATGNAPSAGKLTDWATELGVELAPALSALAAAELVFLDPSGQQVTGGVPFAAGSTAHQVSIASGPTVSANCAVDALGISTMLGRDTDIGSRDPHTSEQVTAVSRGGRWSWQPAEAVVFLGSTGPSGSARLTEVCCPVINFFTGPAHATAYQAEHNLDGIVLGMAEAVFAGALVFGDLLADPGVS